MSALKKPSDNSAVSSQSLPWRGSPLIGGLIIALTMFSRVKPLVPSSDIQPTVSRHALSRFVWLRTARSEEHTSELQSLMRISSAGFCLIQKTTRHTALSDIKKYYN